MKLNIKNNNDEYNKYNFITDDDIVMTDENNLSQNIGHTLSKVINEYDAKIERLESNVKWMYRYGALGSGGTGGSGGGSGTSKIIVSFWKDGVQPVKPNTKLVYSKEGYYSFKIELHGGAGTDVYVVKYSYYTVYQNNKQGYKTDTAELSSQNGFTIEPIIYLAGNHDLVIKIQNTTTREFYEIDDDPDITFPYITSSYNISSYYVRAKDPKTNATLEAWNPSKNTIFMSSIMTTGLMIALDYNIAVALIDNSASVEYNDWLDRNVKINSDGLTLTDINGEVVGQDPNFDIKIHSFNSGLLYLPLAVGVNDDKSINYNYITDTFLKNNNNAAYKQVTVSVIAQIDGSTEKTTFAEFNFNDNLIPNGLFLNIRTDSGKLYNSVDLAKTAQPKNQMSIGDAIFNVTPFNGPLNTSRPYRLTVKLYDVDINNENTETLIPFDPPITITPIDQRTTSLAVPCPDSGIKKIEFTLISGNDKYVAQYFINVKSFTSSFEWYPQVNITEQSSETMLLEPFYSSAYKRNEDLKNIDTDLSTATVSKTNNIQMTSNDRAKTIKFYFDPENPEYTIPVSDDNPIIEPGSAISLDIKSYDIFIGIGIQYYSINDTSKPILSFDAINSTATTKREGTIFVYQDKIAIATSDITIDNNGDIGASSFKEIGIFIPLQDNYEPANTEKYHLFNLYERLEYIDDYLNPHRSVATYIDGILEGLLSTFETFTLLFNNITLYPGNYTINLLEYSLFKHDSLNSSLIRWLEDIDINRYYRSYVEKIIYRESVYSQNEKLLFDVFNNFTYDENNRIIVNSDTATNIVKYASCPVLVLNFVDSGSGLGSFTARNTDNFMGWFEENLKQGAPDLVKHVPVTLQYCDGKSTELTTITLPGQQTAALFYVDRQGSSTKTYRVKNLELYAPDSQDNGETEFIYSPNMMIDPTSAGYTNSFLPERSFTLKADVVDSSHTNNNAIGKFINDNTTPFNNARSNEHQHATKFKSNIKNTLTGFPVLVFLNTEFPKYTNDGTIIVNDPHTRHYFLGIYNFNLGRNSYFNLGYKDVKKIENIVDKLGSDAKDGFVIYQIDADDNMQMPTLCGGEIQDNDVHYDFSQYTDSVILFGDETDKQNPIEGMWGDFIGVDNDTTTAGLRGLCMETAFAGGFIFESIGKEMSEELPYLENSTTPNPKYERFGYSKLYSKLTAPDGTPVTIINGEWFPKIGENQKYTEWVPNYHWQAHRIQDGSVVRYEYTRNNRTATLDDLKNLILSHEIADHEYNIPRVDFISLAEYYTTMMAFGLVDSPMKNLNVKSWNGGETFYLAFYDMDTGLGKNNAGTYINYFAFSDFWRSVYTKQTGTDVNVLNQVNVIRDFSPESFSDDETGSSFFDVPSTYLFAVAKYAKSIFKRFTTDFNSESASQYDIVKRYDPSNIWGNWRRGISSSNPLYKGQSCLKSAADFMKNYFNDHLKSVPMEAFNFNYRYKYLVKDDENGGFDGINFIKFHGKGNAYTEYWLDGRLHILDAYFNVNNVDDTIYTVNGTPIKAPFIDNSECMPTDNSDVYILQDAFTGDTSSAQYTTGQDPIDVTAIKYAPFIMEYNQTSERYLFPAESKTLRITPRFVGNVTARFSGSVMWTSIGSIETFIKQGATFKIKSKYISYLKGTSRTCTDWNLDTPALRTLILNGSGYSGKLEFNSDQANPKFQNLDEIDISNTAIKLNLSNVPVRKLNVSNMQQGAWLIASDLTRLEDVQISGIFTDIQINSWAESISFPTGGTISSPTMTVSNDLSRFKEASIEISGNAKLKTLNLTGFAHIEISGCPLLNSVIITDPETVKTLIINMPKYNYVEYDEDPEKITKFVIGKKTVQSDYESNNITQPEEISSIKVNIPESAVNYINLSDFVNLEKIGFQNSIVEYIALPNNLMFKDNETGEITEIYSSENRRPIKLNKNALNNCKRFINFINEDYNNLFITDEGTFVNCGSAYDNGYKYVKYNTVDDITNTPITSQSISNIYVDKSCTSLKETFSFSDNTGKMTYEIASIFLTERCTGDNVKNVLNIDSMFKNNSIIYDYQHYYIEYLNHTCSLPLWGFTACTSATDIFTTNNIDFFNRYMFEEYGGENRKLFDCLETINLVTLCNSFSHGTIDMLYPFMNKLASIDFKGQPPMTIYNPSTDPSTHMGYTTDTVLYVNDLFVNDTASIYPKYLTVLQNFSLSTSAKQSPYSSLYTQIYNFKGLFDNDKIDTDDYNWKAANERTLTLYNFMNLVYTVGTTNDNYTFDSSYVNKLFCNIVPAYIVNSFAGFESSTSESLNIYTMFNWELVQQKTTNLFCTTSTGQAPTIGGININKTCTYTEFQEIWDHLLKSTELKAISQLFTNCSVTNSTWEDTEFVLSETVVNESITTIPRLFANLKLIANDLPYPIDITSKLFRCLKNIIYVSSIFENTYMKHAIPFDIFAKRKQSSNIIGCKIKTGENTYVDGKVISYEYDRTIVNMNRAFYNITFESKELATFRNAEYNIYEKNYAHINGDDTKYYKYYIYKNNEYIEYNIEQPSELVDISKLWVDLDHSISANNLTKTSVKNAASLIPNVYRAPEIEHIVKDYATQGRQYTNLENFCGKLTAGYVVSPDIFRACSNGCDIAQSIRFDRTSKTDPIIMTGMMPPSIFDSEYLRRINFAGVFAGLNVVPIELPYEDEDIIITLNSTRNETNTRRKNTYYQYILNNFTDRDVVSDSFNFMLLLPASNSLYERTNNDTTYESIRNSQHFIMFGENSLNNNLSAMSNTLPIDYTDVLEDKDAEHMHLFYKRDNGIYFNIMRKFMNKEVTVNETVQNRIEFITGIDREVYKYVMFDNMINGHIAKMLEGYVLSENNSWRFDNVNEGAVVFNQVNPNTGFTGLSANAVLQASYMNEGWYPMMGANYNICKASLPMVNFVMWENYWKYYIVHELERIPT